MEKRVDVDAKGGIGVQQRKDVVGGFKGEERVCVTTSVSYMTRKTSTRTRTPFFVAGERGSVSFRQRPSS